MRLGAETDSGDGTGAVVTTSDLNPGDETLAAAAAALVGAHEQVPPTLSARKVDGVPAYRRVRRGETVELPSRPVTVHAFEVTGRTGPDVDFVTTVSSGTYVRALARDLGRALGCGAHLRALRRMRVGTLSVDEAIVPDGVTPAAVRPPGDAIAHLRRVAVSDPEGIALRHGRRVPTDLAPGAPVGIFAGDELIAVGAVEDGVLQPRVVLVG